jgi:chromosome partitioning protein
MTVLALVNQKGGVGKTTVTLGLAGAAVASGRRVLVVDIDPQANATSGLAVWQPSRTVDDALAADRRGAIAEVVVASGWPPFAGLVPDVAPSSPSLAARETLLATDPIGAQDRLRLALDGVDYDLVLIDCPPSLGLLTINGLFAADAALVVTEPGAWACDGVAQILRTIDRIGQRRPTPLAVAGIAVSRLGRTRDAAYWHEQLRETYPDEVGIRRAAHPSTRRSGRGGCPIAAPAGAGQPLGFGRGGGGVRRAARFGAQRSRARRCRCPPMTRNETGGASGPTTRPSRTPPRPSTRFSTGLPIGQWRRPPRRPQIGPSTIPNRLMTSVAQERWPH